MAGRFSEELLAALNGEKAKIYSALVEWQGKANAAQRAWQPYEDAFNAAHNACERALKNRTNHGAAQR
jgi:hypothetical protein